MKVLFVSSGNSKNGISPIVQNQGQSLITHGINVTFYTIKGKGLFSYIRNIFILRKYLKTNTFEIVHSHFSLSSYVAAFAGARPLVISLMGSDVNSSRCSRRLILFFVKHIWDKVIVKSEGMSKALNSPDVEIIPNGVDLNRFIPMDKKYSQDKLGWINGKRHLVFASDPLRIEKNYSLVKASIDLIEKSSVIDIHFLKNVPNEEICLYMNGADLLLLSSLQEGSPNVIKEAMSCNCPIVTTNVGDVEWVIGNTEGCYISTIESADFTEKLKQALNYSETIGRTNGRERIIDLKLDSVSVAGKLFQLYQKILRTSLV